MMVFSFLFVAITLPRISVLVNVFLKIVEKDSTNRLPVRRKRTKRSLDPL
ncbi:sugar transferase [Streptococcus rubneri]|uniref:Sugar transferase n=1 Tax=Streptococcus rubneri TaxID=1234680 RepID=A0A4Z1DWB2_9STRE|nr:sugar transferase [Streptococcus rubneri]TGN92881.1 sugar transferase [Streptococcus rubneri]